MGIELTHQDHEKLVRMLEETGLYRVLRRLHMPVGPVNLDVQETTKIGIVVDVETTGIDAANHKIIEVAFRRFRFDKDGVILRLDHLYSWLEDPEEPLDPSIVALTGLTNEMLAGCAIDEARASALLHSADICIAHNARFDRRFIERRLPSSAGLAWACSLEEVDWRGRGFDGGGRALGWLLSQCGHYQEDAHRAEADVDAVIAILQHRFDDGTTALAELLATSEKPSWLVAAVGAHFDVKDELKARNYRWNAEDSVWFRQVADSARADELAWLSENVYASRHRPRTDGPQVRQINKFNRYA